MSISVQRSSGIVPAGSISDSELASPNNSAYKTIWATTLRTLSANVTGAAVYMFSTGGNAVAQSVANNGGQFFYLDPADFAIAGLTAKLRLVAACGVADNAPGITLTLGLYPVGSISGGTNVFNPNFGTVVTGTTIAFASPAANSKSAETATSDISFPSAGWYGIGVDASGAQGANCTVTFPFRLERRNV